MYAADPHLFQRHKDEDQSRRWDAPPCCKIAQTSQLQETLMAEKPGLWANIRKKRARIKRTGKGRMRTKAEARKTGLTDATFRKVARKSKRK